MGQRAEVTIKLGSKYYDTADASIDYEWAVAIAFASQVCSFHHSIDHTRPRLVFKILNSAQNKGTAALTYLFADIRLYVYDSVTR